MASREEALSQWKALVARLQPRSALRYGKIGNGAGDVEVDGRPGWVWIRYEENQSRLSMVRCYIGYLEEDTPVLVGTETWSGFWAFPGEFTEAPEVPRSNGTPENM